MNFTDLRQNLAAELDSVVDDADELVVTRSGHHREHQLVYRIKGDAVEIIACRFHYGDR
ncbi:MAG TPA: hypothetical protein VJT31_15790 [Rugosimonospora sp.]|nr:hypothetical protein [Rugosimonospora sp.]